MKAFSKINVLFLILISLNACKKEEPVTTTTPASTGCKISKVDFGGGEYDAYTFNSLGQASRYDEYIKDGTGKIVHTTSNYVYDSNGLLINKKNVTGGQEKYTYANGALTTIEIFDNKNVSIYKVTVTTNANKKIIGMKDSNNFTSKIIRDALGNFTKSETFDENNNLVLREEMSKYDGKKGWKSSLSGWPLNVSYSYDNYLFYGVYFNEPSGNADDNILYWGYDEKGEYAGKLELYYHRTYTKQFNSKGFPTQASVKDALDRAYDVKVIYSYSDCQ